MDQKEQIIEENNKVESVILPKNANGLGMKHYNNLSNNNARGFQNQLNTHQNSLNNGGATGKNQSPNAPSLLSSGNNRNKAQGEPNGVADNLRNKLNTKVQEMKDNTQKKGSEALKKSANPYARATGRLMDAYQKRKQKKKEKEKSSEQDSSSNEDDTDTSSSQYQMDDMLAKGKRRLKIKIIIYTSIIGLAVIMLLSVIMALFGINISSTIPALNQSNYGTDKFTPTYEEGTKEHDNEIKYYEKLKEVSEKYTNENSEEIDKTYVHAVLLYLYYQVEVTDNNISGIPIDYVKMTNMVEKVVELMKPSDKNKLIDYEKKGEFYNNLKNSSDFNNYYKEVLKNKNIDDLLDEIFDLAEELNDIINVDDTVITTETKVVVPDVQNKSNKKTITINDYLAGNIYANTDSINNKELVKAYTIVSSTNIVAKNKKLTIDYNNAQMSGNYCSIKEGCSYDIKDNLVDGPGERNNKNNVYYNGAYYYKKPLTDSDINNLNASINSVFGNVLVTSNGTYTNLDLSKVEGFGDSDYKTILNKSYGNYTLKNIGENSYILDGSFGNGKVLTDVIFYDQGNYASYNFCGLKKETIKSSGCGVTAMAIIASTYEKNRKYDPIYMNNEATNKKMCGSGSGTSRSFFGNEAKALNYKFISGGKYDKSFLNLVLKHLSQGHLVVVRIGPGHFTGGGHYMVLGGVDPETKKVYVYDPNNNSNSSWRKTGNGWYSFNDIIVKEAYDFYIMWKG